MKQTQTKTKKNRNRGFSLVELIVVMAIISVVGLAIVGFLSFCNRQYNGARSEVSVQSKAQVVQRQMDNFMLNTNRAVSWDSTNKRIWLIGQDSGGTYFAECIFLDDGEDKVYFQKYSCWESTTTTGGYEVKAISGEGKQPLADGVEDFVVTIPTNMKQEEKLTVELKLYEGASNTKRTFDTKFELMTRNPVEKAKSINVNT